MTKKAQLFFSPQLSEWRSLPADKPLASIYVKLFGQEVAFANIEKPMIDQAVKVL